MKGARWRARWGHLPDPNAGGRCARLHGRGTTSDRVPSTPSHVGVPQLRFRAVPGERSVDPNRRKCRMATSAQAAYVAPGERLVTRAEERKVIFASSLGTVF